MLRDLKLDSNSHDLDISSGTLGLFEEKEAALAQRVKVAILKKQGEWFKDTLAGVPYFQEFFTKKINKPFIDQYMIEYIGDVEGVASVSSYSSTIISGRKLVIDVTVLSTNSSNVTVRVGE
jgi:hypothetical protein